MHASFATGVTEQFTAIFVNALHAPFDAMRAQYVAAVRAGLRERSMLQGRDVERVVSSMEALTLGPFAKR